MPTGATRKITNFPEEDPLPSPPADSLHATPTPAPELSPVRSWAAAAAVVGFAILQSLCTAVISISALRAAIGIGSLAGASWLLTPLGSIHDDAIRIPMMAIAVVGSFVNLYIVWRIRSLRARPASQWRAQAIPARQRRAEIAQIVLSVITILLVAAEIVAHRIVQHHF